MQPEYSTNLPCADMQPPRRPNWQKLIAFLTGVLIVKVTINVVLGYRNYFPPNFHTDFLLGREKYFFDFYQWAFYSHIFAGPISLALGLILINNQFRLRFPRWHRNLGKLQITIVVLLLAPSGLGMAPYAQTGTVAAIGFSTLSILTAACALLGWRAATRRQFANHSRWMLRCFLLLCSAVIIRIVGGLATVANSGALWIYPLTAWASWLLPLGIFELRSPIQRRLRRAGIIGTPHSTSLATVSSLPAMEMSDRH